MDQEAMNAASLHVARRGAAFPVFILFLLKSLHAAPNGMAIFQPFVKVLGVVWPGFGKSYCAGQLAKDRPTASLDESIKSRPKRALVEVRDVNQCKPELLDYSACWQSPVLLGAYAANCFGQSAPASDVVMVLPFENTSNRPEYNWVGESFADSLADLLNKPGLLVISSDQRELAYQRLRLPETVIPSRATAIKLAREAKATLIVIGTYSVISAQGDGQHDGSKPEKDKSSTEAYVQLTARVIKVNEGRTLGEMLDGGWATRQFDFGGPLTTLQNIHGRLAYQILYQRDKGASLFAKSVGAGGDEGSTKSVRGLRQGSAIKRARSAANELPEERDEVLRGSKWRRSLSTSRVRAGAFLHARREVERRDGVFHEAAKERSALCWRPLSMPRWDMPSSATWAMRWRQLFRFRLTCR